MFIRVFWPLPLNLIYLIAPPRKWINILRSHCMHIPFLGCLNSSSFWSSFVPELNRWCYPSIWVSLAIMPEIGWFGLHPPTPKVFIHPYMQWPPLTEFIHRPDSITSLYTLPPQYTSLPTYLPSTRNQPSKRNPHNTHLGSLIGAFRNTFMSLDGVSFTLDPHPLASSWWNLTFLRCRVNLTPALP